MESQKLTKRVVDGALPIDRRYVIWDAQVPGFGVRVFPSGAKTFIFKYRVGGGRSATRRQPVIGKYGMITVDQAREIAKDWAADVRKGGDPGGERQEKRAEPRMSDLFERYISDHAKPHKKASSVEDDERIIRTFVGPEFGKRKVSEVTRSDIDRFHKSLAETPYRANRVLAMLSKAFNLAEVWGWRVDGSNPCRHVKKFKEERRERFLSAQELARLGDVLNEAETGKLAYRKNGRSSAFFVPVSAVAAIRLLIFTGARRGEILTLQWEFVNFSAARLELPDSKTGAKFVYLPAPALKLLSDLHREADNPYVIVGAKPGTHLVNLKDPWAAIREAAGLNDLRIHDLRHSFASIAAGGGMSLPVIGALLGHKETATTARYAHLSDDPLRAAVELIGGKIESALNSETGSESVSSI